MKTDEMTKETVKGLLKELENLEAALDIMSIENYDAEVYTVYIGYNHNTKSSNSVKIKMSGSLKRLTISEMKNRITEIDEELKKL